MIVSRPVAPLRLRRGRVRGLPRSSTRRCPSRPPTRADDPGFWLYSSGSTGRPKGTVHSHANPYWTGELYGKAVLGLREADVCFSAAKLFFAYGLGNALTFPLSVGATVRADGRAAHARCGVQALDRRRRRPEAHGVLRRADRLRRHAGLARRCRRASRWRCGSCRRPARRCRPIWASASSAHFGVDIVDGIGSTEMLHIFLSNRPGRRALRHHRLAGAGLRRSSCAATTAGRCPTASSATSTSRARAPR